MIFISTDILNPYKRDIVSQDHYNTLIDFLVDKYPNGFKRPTDISVNGNEIQLADYDIELKGDDVVVLLDRAALPVGLIGGWFITALANLAISVTLSYIANKLFAPDAPEQQGQPSSVYNLNSAQNIAMYGSPIPIIYGKVRMFPSMVVQPYYKFEDDVEYLYHVLCIGQGKNTTDEVFIGDDTITNTGDFDWKLLYQDSFYNIPLNAYGIHITKALSVPSTIRLDAPREQLGDETEKYKISADASMVEFDYMFPNGIFWIKDGNYKAENTEFKFKVYTESGGVYTEVYQNSFYDNTLNREAIQRTFSYNISSYNVPVYVSFQRTIDWGTVDMYIKRVKEIYPNEDFTQLYGDITLLACKIKATNTVSSAGQVKVNGYFERTDVGNTMSEVLTDLYTNTVYGGGLSADELSFPITYETVNCAYDSNITIFDAMRKPALAQGYSLYLAGMDVILKKDAANSITSGMYNEMNILRNSFKAQYLFKEEFPSYDGFQCTYIDGDGWIQRSETYPSTSTRPQVVELFGVVDYGQTLSPCATYIPKPLSASFSELFPSGAISASWLAWGSPLPSIVADAGASNGYVLDTNGDASWESGIVSNGYAIPTNKQFKVTFRLKQPLTSSSAYNYIKVGITTEQGIVSDSDGSPGDEHARVFADGSRANGTAPEYQAIYYEAVDSPPEYTYTPVSYDNDGLYHEYEIIYSPLTDGTSTYIIKQDGEIKTCSNTTAPTNPNYYLNVQGRGSLDNNALDWITVEVET